MTSAILSANLLWDNIKRNKVLIIIVGIVMFFAGPFVQILAYIDWRNFLQSHAAIYRNFYQDVSMNILPVVFGIMLAVSILFGLCLALSVTGYMHDRKAAVFFNSIPIKRRVLFTTQCLSGIIYFIAPLVFIYLVSIALMPAYVIFATITKIFVICKFIFLLVYSFTILATSLAGTRFNAVISALYMAFFITAWFSLITFFIESFYRFTSVSSITENFALLSTLPVVYFIGEIATRWTREFFGFVLICLPIMFVLSAAFLFIGGFLNNISKTENAEKPFILNLYR